jgi:single-strand DNA-binding protein
MSSFTINRVVLIGRLTRDPELRALPSGLSVCGLRVACNTSRRDTEGEYHDKPNYFDVSVYGASAENVSRYMHKGSRMAIDGRLDWREWESSEQQKRQSVSVVADTVLFLDSPGERKGSGCEPGDGLDGSETDRQSAGELVGVGAEDGDLVF